MVPQGEARRNLTYKPGEQVVKSTPPDIGDYSLQLEDFGKPGEGGWSRKTPKKFHYRRTQWSVQGTEDEETGQPKKVNVFISLEPRSFRSVLELAYASGYPEAIDLPPPKGPADAKALRALAAATDALLAWVKENAVSIPAHLDHEEYQGRTQARVSWLDPNYDVTNGNSESAAGQTDAFGPVDDDDTSSNGTEEETPQEEVKETPKPNGKASAAKTSGKKR